MSFVSPTLVLKSNKTGKNDHYKMIISKWPGFPNGFVHVVWEISTYLVKCLLTYETLAFDA